MKVYNFSAGPSILPTEVLETAQRELINYNNSGISIMEASHRGKVFEPVHNEAIALFKELMNIPENYEVLFVQGGASMQFEAVPLNLLKKGRADYLVTGNFAKKAYSEAKKYGDIVAAASSEDKNFTYIPDFDSNSFRKDIDYVHCTSNNTIFGTRLTTFPEVENLVCDMSSSILSQVYDVSKFGLIYAGAQKNISCAGLTVVIVRKDLIGNEMPICPTMLKYSTQAKDNSLYNTPPCFAIYIAGLTLKWIKKLGGVSAIQKLNEEKANLLYSFIDNSGFYKNPVVKRDRSLMNIPFITPSDELNSEFCKGAEAAGIMAIKGHRLVGGMRASIYNAMPIDGVKTLIEYMKKFELAHK
ncbi:MAG: 3-phosphoserine/phosphohydroxythreonine transaminase [Clostridia bacterium]